jgi:capsular polysaccharide biosynthesis protein
MELFEGQPRDLDEGPGLLQSVWQYNWLIAIVALVGALLGYAWQARQPTLYEGSTRLLLSIGNSALPGDSTAPPQEPKRFLSNQAELITSRPVLQLAAAREKTTPGDLRARLGVEVAEDADVITIRVRDATPERAARLARAVGIAYDDFVLAQSAKAATREVEQLDDVANDLKGQLQDIAAALQTNPDDPILQARQGAVREQLNATVTRSQGLAARARVGESPVQLQEPAAAPQQPVQPAPRRGAAAGLLLGLVGSAALAWWLNIRRVKEQEAGRQRHGRSWAWRARRAEWQESSTIGDEFGSVQPTPSEQEHMGERTAPAPAAGNGAPIGAMAPLLRSEAADVPAGDGMQDLRDIFERLEATFGSKPLDWYRNNLPQFLTEQLTMRVSVHMAAVLLDNAEGSFVVAGGFGLTAEDQGAIVDQSEDVLRQTLADGVGVFQDNLDRPPSLATGLPGSQSAQALVMVPLVYGPSWLGMLVAGLRSSNGRHIAGFNDQEVEQIIIYALEISPMLQTLLLLDRLQGSVRSLETPRGDHAEPATG